MSIFSVDVGGTNIRCAVVSTDGEILHRKQLPTPPGLNPNGLLAILKEQAKLAGDEIRSRGLSIEAAGVAVPAPVPMGRDAKLTQVPNLPGLEGVRLSAMLSDGLGVRVLVENDAAAAAVGENWKGASRGANTSAYISLGTGIGGGLIIDGRLRRGPDGSAGEIGHICIEKNGRKCGCGSRGCFEQYASAGAILRLARRNGLKVATSEQVFELARHGNRDAMLVFQRVGYYLGILSAALINSINPDSIVFGGKVAGAMRFFGESLKKEAGYRSFRAPFRRCSIVRGKLGDDAAILGVARCVTARDDEADRKHP
jgi:glucokinase